MNWILLFSQLAFAVMAIIMFIRLPSIVREPSGRLAWLGTFTGSIAFAATGAVIPLGLLDSWLGGSNVINLVQNGFATIAFWLMMQAAMSFEGAGVTRRSLWELATMLAAMTTAFLLIPHRSPTAVDFIHDFGEQPMVWVYTMIHMGSWAIIMVRALRGLRGRTARPYLIVRIGAASIAIASAIKMVYITMRVLGVQPEAGVELVRTVFVFPFYGGIIIAMAGLSTFAIAPRARRSTLRALRAMLLRANLGRGFDRADVADAGENAYATYRLAVRLTDIANSEPLTRRERTLLRTTTRVLDRQMGAPKIVRMTGVPSA